MATLVLLVVNFFIERSARNPVIKLSYLQNRQFVLAGTIAMAT
jgi:hypothetical protein